MKTMIRNPFITSGYVSADYFCDRRFESEQLVREVMNGNNLALVSIRRMGKTGLIRHCFQFPEIKQGYYTFFIDIYDSRSLRDLVFALSKEILEVLKPVGKKALQSFWECVKSLQASISFDVNGMPSLNLGLGDIQAPATTLDEIFFPSYDRIIRSAKRYIGSAVLQNNFHCSKLLLSFRYNIIHIISYHTFSKSDRLRHFHHHKRSQADKRFIRLQFFHRMKFHKFFRQLFQSEATTKSVNPERPSLNNVSFKS